MDERAKEEGERSSYHMRRRRTRMELGGKGGENWGFKSEEYRT